MAQLRCQVADGLRPAEASITVRDHSGKSEHFPLDRGMVTDEDGATSIPVFLIQYSDDRDYALVGLPVEADSGSHRIWVKAADLEVLEPVH